MGKVMSRSDVISYLAQSMTMTKTDVKTFMDNLVNLAYKEAKNGFTLPGLGKLVLVHRKARMGRNPATGEAIKISARKALKFRIAKAAKDAVLMK